MPAALPGLTFLAAADRFGPGDCLGAVAIPAMGASFASRIGMKASRKSVQQARRLRYEPSNNSTAI